ncbi:MAG TPA: TonB-dependent receptor [Ignavibacteriales bacterium]|nr:TonB-dependent receptor [Ignavibacteriales bacterium]
MKKNHLLFIIALLIAGSQQLFAQYGKVAGRVIDSDTKEPIIAAVVVLTPNYDDLSLEELLSINTDAQRKVARTDVNGYYTIIGVRPGKYDVRVTNVVGYNEMTVQGISVSIGLTTTQDFEITSKAIQKQEVIVRAQRPLVQKDLTATTSIVNSDLIKELPVTNVDDILKLQAGVTKGGGGELHFRGGRAGQVAYQIDGVTITDGYDNSAVIDVGTSSIQELQVVSGAFNAEFGQAMSGIINIVTKDGDNKFTGNVQAYTGSYYTTRNDLFWNLDKVRPAIRNVDASFSGPIIKDKFFYFTNFRYYSTDGYLYGKRKFHTYNIPVAKTSSQGGGYYIYDYIQGNYVKVDLEPGRKFADEKYVSMNPNDRLYGQIKLTYRLMNGVNISSNTMYDYEKFKLYNHGARLTPDNNLQRFRNGLTTTLTLNHVLSNTTFYNLNFSYFDKQYKHYLFEDIYTGPAYQSIIGVDTFWVRPTNYVDNRLIQNPSYVFGIGGTDNNRFERRTKTYGVKFDLTSQVTKEISIQTGFDVKQLDLFYKSFNLIPMTDERGREVKPYSVMIPEKSSPNYDEYTRKPLEAAAYVQTKIEAFNMILNAGLRFDYFDPDGHILADPEDPNIYAPMKPENQFFDNNGNGIQDPGEATKTVEDRKAYWYKKAKAKYQLSPRLGLAFPITEKGVIHFSYGQFYQFPSYELLYTNPEFKIGQGSGNQGIVGNADLKPQKTIKGEIGVKQQVGDDIAIEGTIFFEDFRDLTGTQNKEILVYGKARSYSQYDNTDFGMTKGFVIKMAKRFYGGLSVNLDYTYSEVKGNASNPADARNAIAGGALPETYIAPLDWDQTHSINLSVAYNKARDFGFSIITYYYSGQPYTPSINKNSPVKQNAFPRNSSRRPDQYNVDLRFNKDFQISGNNYLSIFVNVYNLFDFDNPRWVNTDTGDPYFSFGLLDARKIKPDLYGINTLEQLFYNPANFAEPRRIEIGARYNF